ncbi:hypothetical protein U6B65_12550 [Oscillospiraceae bacterium MB08-C2-2]|nr:hypothetical protein U6B65_12550 [Oscillospiraceae bacterium MB08-C2-2]
MCHQLQRVWLLFGKASGPKTIVTEHGREKMAEAKRNGRWNAAKTPAVTDEQINAAAELLRAYEPAYTNFQAMPPSA